MNKIQKISEQDYSRVADLLANAYPGMEMYQEESKAKFQTRLAKAQAEIESVQFYGFYREDALLGAMRMHDYQMNLYGHTVPVGGVGFVAVDLLHKKEKIAKEMIQYFLQHYRQKGASMTLLYPFRVDFYKKMGFGLGSKMFRYSFKPDSLPSGSKEHIVHIQQSDLPQLKDCYHRYYLDHTGMIERMEHEWKPLLDTPEHHIYGYQKDGHIHGYMVFRFKRAHEENFGYNDLIVREFVYESSDALHEMLAFLHSQADQVNRIIFHTQDETFYYLLSDPRNETNNVIPHVYHESHKAGVGLMYRVVDTRRLFEELHQHNFGSQSCKLRLNILDSLLPENGGSLLLDFQSGKVNILEEGVPDVEVTIPVSEFSSLIMGAVSFKTLLRYGLVTLSDRSYEDLVHALFQVEQPPVCMTGF